MNWITIVWSMNAGACLALATIYFVLWCNQRKSWMHLAFSCSAAAGAALAAFELALLRAQTTEQYGVIVRWAQLPVWVLVVSLVVFVRLYLRAGRQWLAWTACCVRTLALILNFLFIPNLSYREITSLRRLSWWGGQTVSAPVGVTNPWILVAQLSSLLLIVFFIDATITVWRQGDRQRALRVGGSLILFSLIAIGEALLVVWGIIQVPFLVCFAILGLLAVMGYQLCGDVFRAAHLARELEVSQAALRKTEQAMEIAANAVDLALWTWDIASDEIWLSHKARAVFGFSASERLDTERIRSVIHPEDRELVRKAVRDSLQTGAENPVEYRVVLPNGEIRWLVRRSRTEFEHNGKPVLMHGILFDITERKFAEERFRLAVDAAPAAMIMVNKEGRITLTNKQVEALFGYKRDELIDQPVEMLIPERFWSHHADYRHDYFRDPKARPIGVGGELFGQCKDDSKVPVEIGLNPVQTAKGLCVLASIIDIRERKQAELQAQQQRNEVEELRREKTALLEKEVAERARLEREVIEICTREQQRIAYDLHDGVGQQLVGVALNAKLLEQELRAACSAEAEKASKIVRLANQAARQARLTARNLEGADGVGDLKTALQKLVASVRRDCRVDGIVKAEGDASSFPVGALVAAQLYRIAQEAVHNAVEHGGARKVEIDLARNHENLVLTVRDNGKGFDTSAISKGMGLRIMRYRAQCVGGSCEVQSNRTKSTVVTCRVPLRTEVAVRPIP